MAENIQSLDLLTAAETAEILRLNPQVLLRKLQSGEIPAYKIGKDWRISRVRLLEWLERHSNQNAGSPNRLASTFFDPISGKLKSIPAQRKKRAAVLEVILTEFEPNRVYDEKEVNEIIRRFHSDVCTIRREFVMEKMMTRKEGKYMRNGSYPFRFEK